MATEQSCLLRLRFLTWGQSNTPDLGTIQQEEDTCYIFETLQLLRLAAGGKSIFLPPECFTSQNSISLVQVSPHPSQFYFQLSDFSHNDV